MWLPGSIKGAFEVRGQEFKLKLVSMVIIIISLLYLAACADLEEVEKWGLTVHDTRDEQ